MTSLKRFRIQNDIRPQKICKELGISRSTLSRYETGAHFPRPEMILKIQSVTNGQVTANDLLAKRKR